GFVPHPLLRQPLATITGSAPGSERLPIAQPPEAAGDVVIGDERIGESRVRGRWVAVQRIADARRDAAVPWCLPVHLHVRAGHAAYMIEGDLIAADQHCPFATRAQFQVTGIATLSGIADVRWMSMRSIVRTGCRVSRSMPRMCVPATTMVSSVLGAGMPVLPDVDGWL